MIDAIVLVGRRFHIFGIFLLRFFPSASCIFLPPISYSWEGV